LAISLPSDIVLDVARAVEPAHIETARAELVRRGDASGAANAEAFSLGDFSRPAASAKTGAAGSPDTFKRFEAMVLQTFIQNMLPKDAESVYGKGLAGDMWKSMMAGRIADVMAERGGIGIAERVLTPHYSSAEGATEADAADGGPGIAESDEQVRLSQALVQEMQRRIAQNLFEDRSAETAAPKS